MKNNYKLTIAIISYNRPKELLRTVRSLLPISETVEILICDDNSPKISEILIGIKSLETSLNLRFISNSINLGYDRNLFHVIEVASSNNVLLLGDDDYLEVGAVENILRFVSYRDNYKCAFLRFKDENEIRYHRFSSDDLYFDCSAVFKDGSFIYNSILFSGILVNRDEVLDNKHFFENYFNSIYIQVAIFTLLSFKYGSYAISGPGIIVGGDGQSGFGFNDSASSDDFELKDRSNILSNLVYHKRLFKVIVSLSEELGVDIFNVFLREYRIRSIKALVQARIQDRKFLKLYWNMLNDFNVFNSWFYRFIYLFIYIFPRKITSFTFLCLENVIMKYRTLDNTLKNKINEK